MPGHDDEFWLSEATLNDIADKRLTIDQCLNIIIPEFEKHVTLEEAYILEIGCGVGRLTIPMKRQYPEAHVVGIDVAQRFLNIADKNSGWIDNCKLPEGKRRPATDYPFFYCRDDISPASNVEAIYTMTVFQHIQNEAKRSYVTQAGKALRKGGAVVVQYVERYSEPAK